MNDPAKHSVRPRKRRTGSLFERLVQYERNSTFLPPFSLRGWVFFLAGLVPALIVGWFVFPMVLYSEQPQPLNFNHARHLSEDIGIQGDTQMQKCLYCHGFRKDGTFEGNPRLASCMECHDDPDAPLGITKEEEKFLANYVARGKEIPWHIYSKQPDCVYFSHIAHVKMGNLDCRVCHGDFANSRVLPPYKANRLTGYSINIWGKRISGYKLHTWDRMKMDDCAECHAKTGRKELNACFVCHK